MFLFFPFILPVNLISYLHRVRGSQTYALLRKVPHRRRRNEEQLLSSSSSNTPFLSSISLSLITIVLTIRKKKKKRKVPKHSLILSHVCFFLSFLPSFFFFLHFITFLYIIQADLSFEKEIFFPSLWRRLNNRERGIERKGKGSRKTRSFCFRESFIPSIPLQTK